MADARLAATADDDIPRTFKRAREAKEREAREAREREARERESRAAVEPEWRNRDQDDALSASHERERASIDGGRYGGRNDGPDRRGQRAVVTAFEVPFFRLAFFLIKVVLAGIPALLLLTALLWLFGQGVAAYAPELLKMKILITFPGGAG